MKNGFSLVELSIVLVILGLLTGGILGGQALIRAAELRSLTADFTRYKTAMMTFRDKYFALPGDMPNATAFWGKDNTNCASDTGTASTPGTCNGNGNGIYDGAAGASMTGEEFQYWKQLALAGMIEGTYSGLSGPLSNINSVIGTNVPRTRLSNGGYSIQYIGSYVGDSTWFDGDYGNVMQAGTQYITNRTGGPLVKPEEMWNIDTKMDDGRPTSGFVFSEKNTSANAPNCTDGVTAGASYNFSFTSAACRILMEY